jgi:hypothetical protein
MIRTAAAQTALGLSLFAALPALAADPKIDAAIKTFEQVATDPARLATYCTLAKLMDETADDENKAKAAEPQIDGYVKTLGPEFDAAMSAIEGLDEKSPDAKAFDAALDKLDLLCPK